MPPELPSDYYLQNFRQLLRFVRTTYGDILSEDERRFFDDFDSFSRPAQCLYVRLLCRKHRYFRLSRLSYVEIPDVASAVCELGGGGFVSSAPEMALAPRLDLFTRAELRQALSPSAPSSIRRPELLQQVLQTHDAAEITHRLAELDVVVEVFHEERFVVYRLCFFGNLYQDMTDFVLRDLGLLRYERYRLDRTTRAFQDRKALDAHRQYFRCAEQLESVLEGSAEDMLELHRQLPPVAEHDVALQRRAGRLINRLARQLERLHQPEAALSLYRCTEEPPSRERQVRVLGSIGDVPAALALCRRMLEAPFNDEEHVFAQQFGQRLARRYRLDWPVEERYTPPTEVITLAPGEDSVESLAAAHLSVAGSCHFVENTLFNGVFGLVLWDIVYAPLQGVFHNPFQSGPADLHQPVFYLRRASLIEQRWRELADPEQLRRRVMDTFTSRQGLQNPFVHWQQITPELLSLAVSRIPWPHWLAVFQRLLLDTRHHRTGFPDLILFPRAGGYRLIEIKGPGDTLQKNQLRWMKYFAAYDIPHELLNVRFDDESSYNALSEPSTVCSTTHS